MSIYEIKNRGARHYECTNIIAARADTSPGENWKKVDRERGMHLLTVLTQLWTEAGITYYGYL